MVERHYYSFLIRGAGVGGLLKCTRRRTWSRSPLGGDVETYEFWGRRSHARAPQRCRPNLSQKSCRCSNDPTTAAFDSTLHLQRCTAI